VNRRKFLQTTAGAVAALAAAPALALLPKLELKSLDYDGLLSQTGTVASNATWHGKADLTIADIERTLSELWSNYRMEPERIFFPDRESAERFLATVNAIEFNQRVKRKRGFNGVRQADAGLRITESAGLPIPVTLGGTRINFSPYAPKGGLRIKESAWGFRIALAREFQFS